MGKLFDYIMAFLIALVTSVIAAIIATAITCWPVMVALGIISSLTGWPIAIGLSATIWIVYAISLIILACEVVFAVLEEI